MHAPGRLCVDRLTIAANTYDHDIATESLQHHGTLRSTHTRCAVNARALILSDTLTIYKSADKPAKGVDKMDMEKLKVV